MTYYKDELAQAMGRFAERQDAVIIGYNVAAPSFGGGSFRYVDPKKLIEMPLAENLMMGVAMGMALTGHYPLVYFERFDFVTNAMDAIVNHLDKMEALSRGQFDPKVLIRVVAGNRRKPLHTGATHIQDFSVAMRAMVKFPVIGLMSHQSIQLEYNRVISEPSTKMLVEYKDLYEEQQILQPQDHPFPDKAGVIPIRNDNPANLRPD